MWNIEKNLMKNYSEGFSNDFGGSLSFEKRTVSKSSSVIRPSVLSNSGWIVTRPVLSSLNWPGNNFVFLLDWSIKKPLNITLAAKNNSRKTEMPYKKGIKLLKMESAVIDQIMYKRKFFIFFYTLFENILYFILKNLYVVNRYYE